MKNSQYTDPATIALHFAAGGDTVNASKYFEIAAKQASQALAFDMAAGFYRKVLESRFSSKTSLLQEQLADSLANAGWSGDAAKVYFELSQTTVFA